MQHIAQLVKHEVQGLLGELAVHHFQQCKNFLALIERSRRVFDDFHGVCNPLRRIVRGGPDWSSNLIIDQIIINSIIIKGNANTFKAREQSGQVLPGKVLRVEGVVFKFLLLPTIVSVAFMRGTVQKDSLSNVWLVSNRQKVQ